VSAPARPRAITTVALLIAWLSVSLAFFSLARPVQEWAGEGWVWVLVVAAFTLLFGWLAAYALWTQRRWALLALNLWCGSLVAGTLMILTGRQMLTVGSVIGVGVLMIGCGVLTGWVKGKVNSGAGE
jgi:hypothetical protein